MVSVRTLRLGANLGELVVSGGIVELRNADALSPSRRNELLRGPGEGYAAHCAGKLVLHGSCVRYGSLAVSFVGPSGAGKSSISVALCRRGAALVSDGLTIVEPSTLEVTHRYPWWRMQDDALLRFGHEPAEFAYDDSLGQKRRLEASRAESPVVARLAHVFLVETGTDVQVISALGVEQILGLLRNVYLGPLLPDCESASLLERCNQVLGSGLKVHRLLRPKDWNSFEHLIGAIEQACT